jgi:HTH-type transcriptional regulator/antitoxin HigA
MIAKGAPHVIQNDQELEAYTDALFQLTALQNPTRSELEAIELPTLLVERYEETHYRIPFADAVSVVRFLLEGQDLRQRDLIPEFGSESAVSMFLAKERKLTLQQVRKLSKRFKLSADVFCPKPIASLSENPGTLLMPATLLTMPAVTPSDGQSN